MAVAAMIVAAVVTAYSAVRSGQAQSAAADYNKKVAQQNAAAMDQQSQAAREQQHQDLMRKLGLMQANYGASGVDPTTGSPLDVFADSVQKGTLDDLTTKYNYQMKALGYQNSATLDSFQSDQASTSGYLNGASALLGGASKAYGYYAGGSGGGTPVSNY